MRADSRPERADSRPEKADFRPERAGFRPERANFRPERADSRPERADFRPERADFRPERAYFRPERAWGGRTNEQKPPVFYRTLSPSGPLPKKKTHYHIDGEGQIDVELDDRRAKWKVTEKIPVSSCIFGS